MPQQDGVYERKDSPYWWASYVNGSQKRVRRSTGVRRDVAHSRREAEALLASWKTEAHQELMWGKPAEAERHTFDEVLWAYLKGHKVKTPLTVRMPTARKLLEAFGGRDVAAITELEVRQYVRRRMETVKAATVNKEVGMMSAACNWCQQELGWDIPNPSTRKKKPEPEGRVRWITDAEAQELIEAARKVTRAPWLADYIQLSLFTGMRSGEVVGLTWDRVDLDRRVLLLETGTTKNDRRRSVPLHRMALEALQSRLIWRNHYCPDSPWVFCNKKGHQVKDMKNAFATAKQLAGLEDFRRHDQRHTLASWMVMSGAELVKVRDMLGHSTIKMTERYAHLHPEALREAVDSISASRFGHAHQEDAFRTGEEEEKS